MEHFARKAYVTPKDSVCRNRMENARKAEGKYIVSQINGDFMFFFNFINVGIRVNFYAPRLILRF